MFHTVRVIGHGRLGSVVEARLVQRQHAIAQHGAVDLILVCVPDGAIAATAADLAEGPWVAHMSGATSLAALAPHARRFSVHPLQTFVKGRGPEQLDGAWAAVSGETPEALARATWLAGELGLRPFELSDERRVLYHAGAAMASNYLVTLYRAASRALERAGAPPEALVPLMRRTIENGFELTGPIARGDWSTVDAHLDAIRRELPELEAAYRALAKLTAP